MIAVILAGGQAKRLWPITADRPKSLLKINNKTIVDYQMESLLAAGVKKFVFIVGFQAQKLEKHLREKYPEADFVFINNKNFEKTNPAYALWLARKYFDDDVLCLSGDLLFDPEIIKQIVANEKKCLTAMQRVPWEEESANVIINDELRILEIGKHICEELSHGEFIGLTKFDKNFNKEFKKALADFVKEGEHKKFMVDAMNLAIQQNCEIHALDVTHLPAIEIDTHEDLARAKRLWEKYENGA